MNNPLVVFTSKYGSTRRYAAALGRRLGVPAVELGDLDSTRGTDPLIVLAPVYATRIRGRRRIVRALRSAPGRAALVVVALSPPGDPGRGTLADSVVAASGRTVTTFHLRGDFDPARLRLVDRILMAALRRELRKTPDQPAAAPILSGERLEYVDEATLDPVVAWAVGRDTVEP